MASKIRVLHDNTINKIAAGEVIENPASVVKELVENSLDAGATDITIEILAGGRQLIRITDNGCGMNNDDALLCLERHATSKIREVEDIHEIATMGFRGEAIPSIASISKFTLLTCPYNDNSSSLPSSSSSPSASSATMVIVDGGQIIKCCSAERSPGTTIEIKSLFFNVPVRKKFQKSPSFDAQEIQKIVSILALGNPTIKFKLISNHQTVLSTPYCQHDQWINYLGERIATTLGSDFFSALIPIEEKQGAIHIRGFIGKPSYDRHNRTGQYLFINQRPVFSPLIAHLIREGYGTTLGNHRFPVFVLHLTLPGSSIDVNVHPQKKEVRLRQEKEFKGILLNAIEKGIRSLGITYERETVFHHPNPFKESRFFEKGMTDYSISSPFVESLVENPLPPQDLPWMVIKNPEEPLHQETPATSREEPWLAFRPQPQEEPAQPQACLPLPVPALTFQVIGTLKNYILAFPLGGKADTLCVIDQQAAHQRIFYEQLLGRHPQSSHQRSEIQSLLIPITLDFNHLETMVLQENLEELNALGFGIKDFGQNTFMVDAIPVLFQQQEIRAVISSILHDLSHFQGSQIARLEKNKRLVMSASQAAMRGVQTLSVEQAQHLMNRLVLCDSPFQCPQGNPIKMNITPTDFKQWFAKK